MVLGVDKLLELVIKDGLVSNLSERELTNPEGCGFDLRLGKIHKLSGAGYLGISERNTPNAILVMEYKEKKPQSYHLQPGETIIVTTIESVKLPTNLTATLFSRSTLYRSGVLMRGGNVSPGYAGELSVMLSNTHSQPFTIEMGARFIHIIFMEVKGKANAYRGQWTGGRVSAKDKEVQV